MKSIESYIDEKLVACALALGRLGIPTVVPKASRMQVVTHLCNAIEDLAFGCVQPKERVVGYDKDDSFPPEWHVIGECRSLASYHNHRMFGSTGNGSYGSIYVPNCENIVERELAAEIARLAMDLEGMAYKAERDAAK